MARMTYFCIGSWEIQTSVVVGAPRSNRRYQPVVPVTPVIPSLMVTVIFLDGAPNWERYPM
jgi:hypothetical protein